MSIEYTTITPADPRYQVGVLYDKHWTTREIACHLGLSQAAVQHALRKLGRIKKDSKRKPLDPAVREAVVQIDGIRCHYCGVRTIKEPSLGTGGVPSFIYKHWENRFRRIDHKIPVAHGGTNALSNLVVACRLCNAKKYTRSYEEFKSITPYLDADSHPELPPLEDIPWRWVLGRVVYEYPEGFPEWARL